MKTQPTSWRRTGTTRRGFRRLTSEPSGRPTPRPVRVDHPNYRTTERIPWVDEPAVREHLERERRIISDPRAVEYYQRQQELKRGAVRQAAMGLISAAPGV